MRSVAQSEVRDGLDGLLVHVSSVHRDRQRGGFSGISGAALLIPLFLIGFPLLDAPQLTTVAAIGTALMLETSGFGMGVYRYLHFKLADLRTALFLIVVTLPLGALGAIAAPQMPEQGLRLGYGAAMVVLGGLMALELRRTPLAELRVPVLSAGGPPLLDPPGALREITTRNGIRYSYQPRGLRGQRAISGVGAFVAGLISTGVGEATMPPLVRRSRFPVPVAAATSTVVVAGTVVGAATTHAVQLVLESGFSAVPWNLIVWAVPGALIGATIGTRQQGRVEEHATKVFFSGLFLAIGLTFLIAFTLLGFG
jgi:uncharacterized membrane protein YfcA